MEHRNGVAHIGSKLFLNDLVRCDEFVGIKLIILDRAAGNINGIPFIDTLILEHAKLGVGVVHLLANEVKESIRKHIAAAKTGTGNLCSVGRTDSAASSADLLAGRTGSLFGLVERTVVKHHHLRTC